MSDIAYTRDGGSTWQYRASISQDQMQHLIDAGTAFAVSNAAEARAIPQKYRVYNQQAGTVTEMGQAAKDTVDAAIAQSIADRQKEAADVQAAIDAIDDITSFAELKVVLKAMVKRIAGI